MKVLTRYRTMSGRPGGRQINLDPATAKDWIKRGWADSIEPEKKVKEKK